MDDSFFEFKSKFPLSSLSDGKLEEQLLTDNVEEEYDALNDETFGIGADDGDWEEDHDKFAELIKEQSSFVSQSSSSLFDVSGFDGDDSQHEIVSQSISQLGLEDDLGDPAIMTIGRSRNIWPLTHVHRSSPPPPAIIDPELCGSPKTHSIWSTSNTSSTAKESGIGSLFSSLGNSCSSYQHHVSPVSPVPCNVFSSPLTSKAWTLEEIERDLTSKSVGGWSGESSNHSEQNSTQTSKLSVLPELHNLEQPFANAVEKSVDQKTVPGVRTLDDVETDILLKHQTPTVEEIERSMKSKTCRNSDLKRTYVVPPMGDGPFKQVMWPLNSVRTGFSTPIGQGRGIRPNGPFTPFASPVITSDKASSFPGAFRTNYKPLHVYPQPLNAITTAATFGKGHIPQNKQVFFPTSVLNPQNMKSLIFGPGRFLRHPLLGTPVPDYTWRYAPPATNRFSFNEEDTRPTPLPENYDEYSGLMTQREKEWLLRIQLMLVQTDNPYVEDFYYSTFITRKCVQEALKNKSDKKDGPKLLLPERSKTETKAYVPAQFEGSLGKLQAVSVNFPRKVLDITVSRPLEDDEGHPITNQSVTKNRRLLLNIEKLYNFLLEIDDEEKRILALPESAHGAHHDNIEKLTEKLFTGLGCDSVTTSDTFQNIMMVRKGRNLGLRSFNIFSKEQKLCFLVALCRCFSHVLRKDQNDMILLKNCDCVINHIKTLTLPELVSLGQSLENLPRTDTVIVPNPVREKSNFISAFKYKFGTSVVCCIMQQAEDVYAGYELIDSEDQAKWAKVMLHIVDIICTLPDSSIVPPVVPYENLLAHFQRFAVDRDKFEVLKKKLSLFNLDCGTPDSSV